MYLLKHIKLDKDSILVGRPREEEWAALADQGYQLVLDILPPELREKGLAKLFPTGTSAGDVIRAVEKLSHPLKGRPDIKRFITEFYQHYRQPKGLRSAE